MQKPLIKVAFKDIQGPLVKEPDSSFIDELKTKSLVALHQEYKQRMRKMVDDLSHSKYATKAEG